MNISTIKKIKRAYECGCSIRDITGVYGLKRSEVMRALNRLDSPPKRPTGVIRQLITEGHDPAVVRACFG